MAGNFYFNNFGSSQEQRLIENLIIESIKIYGQEMYYLPKTLVNYDPIYGSDQLTEFKNAILVEFYIKNVEGFGGQGDFLSKFGVEIRDQTTLSIARRVFEDEVQAPLEGIHVLTRPREGDLIFFPLNKKLFEIKFVEHEAIYYQLGALQTYDLKCELFEFTNQRFSTGIADVDRLNNLALPSASSNAAVESVDGQAINAELQTQADDILDFTQRDPFSEGGVY